MNDDIDRHVRSATVVWYWCIGLLLLPALTGASEGSNGLGFEIFRRDDNLHVSVSLASIITSDRVDLLKNGIDVAVDYSVFLTSPKRFWGSELLAQTTHSLIMEYRLPSDQYVVCEQFRDTCRNEHSFVSLRGLHRFLADSLTTEIAFLDSLDRGRNYQIKVTCVCISMTALNLKPPGEAGDESPLEFLFRQFLKLTNYGREELSAVSRPFKLSEVRVADF